MNRPEDKMINTRMLQACFGLLVLCCLGLTGCTSILSPIQSIPADRIPPEFLAPPRATDEQIDFALLGQEKPPSYFLDEDDILGIYIENILGGEGTNYPVQFPGPESDLAPSIGYPVPVRENGTISLPYLNPIPVRGLTVPQVEDLIKRTYQTEGVLVDPKTIVTLMRKRTYRVFVVRQDNTNFNSARNQQRRSAQAVTDRSDESGRGFVLQLPAYENDVINALTRTGGLPGVNARSDLKVLRASRNRAERQSRLAGAYSFSNNNSFPNDIPGRVNSGEANVVTIPLRLKPGQRPNFRATDIILNEGDILYVENRDSEVYYTGGLLGGGEWNLPRDYDLDVLAAIAVAGTSIGVDRQGLGGGLQAASGSRVPPTQLIVLRQLPNQQQIAIEVDLTAAINNPRSRILVAPRDTLILRYKPEEELANFAIGTFFTYGIRQLFRN